MLKKFYLTLPALIIVFSTAFAQQRSYPADTIGILKTNTVDIHFNGFAFLDDHEYDALIPLRKTISGTRTTFDVGLNVDSINRFVVGANALHEFGAIPFFLTVNPVAYYSYHSSKLLFNAGEFPRQDLLTQYPRALLNDTLQYYRPNVEGLLLRGNSKFGYETGWIDWISRQTATQRNMFMAGELGTFRPSASHPFYISHYFLFEHNAGSKSDTAADIQDSGGAQLRLGLDLSHRTIFDSLKIEFGGMGTVHRTRSQYQFQLSEGIVASLYLAYKRFSLLDEFYRGQPNYLTFADPFYIKPIYNRVDLIYTAFLGSHFRGEFILGLHQSPARLTDSQPGFKIVYDLGRKVIARFSDDHQQKSPNLYY